MKITFVLSALVLAASLSSAVPTLGQSSSPAGFVASSDALAIDCAGTWSLGNRTDEVYDLVDFGASKTNRLFVGGSEITAPGCSGGLAVFGGTVSFQPDLTKLFSLTNLSAGNFLASFNGFVGNGIPGSGADHIASGAGGKVQYILTDSTAVNVIQCGVLFFGAARDPYCSAGLIEYFGGTPASAAVSSNVKRSLLARAAKISARLAEAAKAQQKK